MVGFTGCCLAHLALGIWHFIVEQITVSAITSDMQYSRKSAFELVEVVAAELYRSPEL
jgi:succinate dehydrogenase/fumarate reductase cytochrome b subunit